MSASRPPTGPSALPHERVFGLATTPTPMANRNDLTHRQMLHTLKRCTTPSQDERRDALMTCILSGGNTIANPFRDSNPEYLYQQQRVDEQKRRAPQDAYKANLEKARKAVRKACGADRPQQFDDAEDIASRMATTPKLTPVLQRKLAHNQQMQHPSAATSLLNRSGGSDGIDLQTKLHIRPASSAGGGYHAPNNSTLRGAGSHLSTSTATNYNKNDSSISAASHMAIHNKPFGIYSSGGSASISEAHNADLSRISEALQKAISPAGYITRPMLRATSAPQGRMPSQEANGNSPYSPSKPNALSEQHHTTFEVQVGGDYHSPFGMGGQEGSGGGGADGTDEGMLCQDEIAIFELKRAARRRADQEEHQRALALQLQLEMGLNNAISSARVTPATGAGGARQRKASSPNASPQKTPLAFTNFSRPGTTYSVSSSFSSQRNFKDNLEYAERPPMHPSVLQSVVEQRRAQEAYFGEKISFGGVDEDLLAEEEDRRFGGSSTADQRYSLVDHAGGAEDDTEYYNEGIRMDDPTLDSNFATNQDGFEVIDVRDGDGGDNDFGASGDDFEGARRPSSTQSMNSKPMMNTARPTPAHPIGGVGVSRPSSTASSAIVYSTKTNQIGGPLHRGSGAGSAGSRAGKPPLIPKGILPRKHSSGTNHQPHSSRSAIVGDGGGFEGSDEDFENTSTYHKYSRSNSKHNKSEAPDSSDEEDERVQTALYNKRLHEGASSRRTRVMGTTATTDNTVDAGGHVAGFDDEDIVADFVQQTESMKAERLFSANSKGDARELPTFDTSVAGTLPRNPFSPPKIIAMLFTFANVAVLPCVATMKKLGYSVLYERFHGAIDKSSCLTKSAYMAVMKSLMPTISIKEAERLFGCFERTGRGDIDVNVFLMGLQMLLGCATPGDALRYCIKSMDPRNGTPRYITRYEIQSILRCVQIQHSLLVASNDSKGIAELTAATTAATAEGGAPSPSQGKSSPPPDSSLAGAKGLSFMTELQVPTNRSPSGSPVIRHRNSSSAGSRGGNSPPSSPTNTMHHKGSSSSYSTVEGRRAAFAAKIANAAKGFGDTKANNYFGPQTVLSPNVLISNTNGSSAGSPSHANGSLSRHSLLDQPESHRKSNASSAQQLEGRRAQTPQNQPQQRGTTPTSVNANGKPRLMPIQKLGGANASPKAMIASLSDVHSIGERRLNSAASIHRPANSNNNNNITTASGSKGSAAITIGGSVGSGVAVDREFTVMHNAIVDLFEDTTRYDYLGRMALREFVDYIAQKLTTNIRARRSSTIGGPVGVLEGGPLVAPAHRLNSKQLVLQHVHQTFVDTKGVNK